MSIPESVRPARDENPSSDELGMPTLGGATPMASGLVFSAASDYYLRAVGVMTGEVVWKSQLPVGVGSTPLVFMSPEDGRQFVVVTANGARVWLRTTAII